MSERAAPAACRARRLGSPALALATALLATTLCPPGAWAAEITFKVPVNLTALHPDVEGARVSCRIESAAGLATGSTPLGPPVGGSIQREATVTVAVDPLPVMANHKAKWICVLTLVAKGTGPHMPPVPSYTHPLLPLRARTGTPLVTQVEGVLTLPVSK